MDPKVPPNPMWFEPPEEGSVCPKCDCDTIFGDKCENEDCGFEFDPDVDKMDELGL